jgi:hypothetical protein
MTPVIDRLENFVSVAVVVVAIEKAVVESHVLAASIDGGCHRSSVARRDDR